MTKFTMSHYLRVVRGFKRVTDKYGDRIYFHVYLSTIPEAEIISASALIKTNGNIERFASVVVRPQDEFEEIIEQFANEIKAKVEEG